MFIILVITGRSESKLRFKIDVGIGSNEQDFDEDARIIFLISSGDTVLNLLRTMSSIRSPGLILGFAGCL